MTSTFWKAVESLPGLATDRRDWKSRLGEGWNAGRHFLVATGRVAREIACPQPGGDHCPRQIVHHADGTIRAVCLERLCTTLTMSSDDIRILEIDRAKVFKALAAALDLRSSDISTKPATITRIGLHLHQASIGIPVFIALPEPQSPITPADLQNISHADLPFLLLLPGDLKLGQEAAHRVGAMRGRAVRLDDVVDFGAGGSFAARLSAETIFRREHELLEVQLNPHGSPPQIQLPAGTLWPKVSITFVSEETITVSAPNYAARSLEPSQLGLMDKRTQKANARWALLRLFAEKGGKLPLHAAKGTGSHQKRVQTLSNDLQRAFGIDGAAITVRGDTYVTSFLIRDGGLSQGRAGQQKTKIR